MEATPETKRKAAEAIGRGLSVAEAARVVGVHERSVRRWLREEPRLRDVAQRTGDRLLSPTAVSALEDALLATRPGGAADHPTRVRAAVALLQHAGGPAPEGQELPDGAIVIYPEAAA